MTTATTLAHHLQVLTEDVDAIMLDYTSESVLLTPGGAIRGLDGIRGFFADFLTQSPPALLQAIRLLHQQVEGEVAFITWNAEPFIPLATDTFLIRDDTILVQTFVAFTLPTGS